MALALLAVGTAAQAQVIDITIAGGQVNGAYNRTTTALAAYMTENVEGIRASSEATTGSLDNIRSLSAGNVEFGPAFASNVFEAYRGQGAFDAPLDNLRTVAYMFGSVGHFVVPAESDIHSLDDIKGLTISMGGPGSGSAENLTLLLEHAGLWGSFTPVYSGSRSPNELQNGTIDAYNWHPGIGNAMIRDTGASMDIRLVDMNQTAEASGFYEKYPYFVPMTIPGGVYPGVDEDVATFGTGTLMMTHADVPDDVVYKLLEVLYSEKGMDFLAASAGNVIREATIEAAFQTATVPLHPGALRYFRDQGVEVPAELVAE